MDARLDRRLLDLNLRALVDLVRMACLDLPYGQSQHFRLEEMPIGAGTPDPDRTLHLKTEDGTPLAVRLVPVEPRDQGSVALSAFHGTQSLAEAWARLLWERRLRPPRHPTPPPPTTSP